MQATLTIQHDGEGGLDAAFSHTFNTDNPVLMACAYAKLKAELSRQVVEYTRLLSEQDLETYRAAEIPAAIKFGNKLTIDANMALWEDGR